MKLFEVRGHRSRKGRVYCGLCAPNPTNHHVLYVVVPMGTACVTCSREAWTRRPTSRVGAWRIPRGLGAMASSVRQ